MAVHISGRNPQHKNRNSLAGQANLTCVCTAASSYGILVWNSEFFPCLMGIPEKLRIGDVAVIQMTDLNTAPHYALCCSQLNIRIIGG